MIRENFGGYLKRFRKDNKVSQTDIAILLETTQKKVSEIEAGKARISPVMMDIMVRHRIIPKEAVQVPEQMKKIMENMPFDDQMMLVEMARRLMQ